MAPSTPRRLLRQAPAARRLRLVWERVRPVPLPRYLPNTPRVGGDRPELHFPPTAATLGAAAMSEETLDYVLGVLDRLMPNEQVAQQQLRLRWGKERFGKHWRRADLLTTVCAAAYFTQPAGYLEIGVWRGRSLAVVGSMCPSCDIYGFDLWIPDYAGAPNPGPEFVREELRRIGHAGNVTLVSGDSRATLPTILRERPDLFFDMITLDGDKSIRGAGSDFAHALPRLKVGGILVFDDLPIAPMLRRIWRKLIEQDDRYVSWEFADAKMGVAAAIRVAE